MSEVNVANVRTNTSQWEAFNTFIKQQRRSEEAIFERIHNIEDSINGKEGLYIKMALIEQNLSLINKGIWFLATSMAAMALKLFL